MPCSSTGQPDPWVTQHATHVPQGNVLDLACGKGRHGRYFLDRHYAVTFTDKDTSDLEDLKKTSTATLMQHDLENNQPWPFHAEQFSGIVIVNYLYRPIFPLLLSTLQPGGVLIYKTFAVGNEEFGRPRNPDFLLHREELLNLVSPSCDVIDYTQRHECNPTRVTQAIAAKKLSE